MTTGRFKRDFGLSAAWWDSNGGGLPDLHIGSDNLEGDIGDSTFRFVIAPAPPHSSWFSMGAVFADIYKNDLLEFLTADMSGSMHFKRKNKTGVTNVNRPY